MLTLLLFKLFRNATSIKKDTQLVINEAGSPRVEIVNKVSKVERIKPASRDAAPVTVKGPERDELP